MRGCGTGGSGGSALSFTYGLSAEDSSPYLELPAGKELKREGNELELVAAVPFPLRQDACWVRYPTDGAARSSDNAWCASVSAETR